MGPGWSTVRELHGEFSARAPYRIYAIGNGNLHLFTKEPLFTLLARGNQGNAQALGDEIWTATKLIDKLGLYTAEIYQQSRDDDDQTPSSRSCWSFPLRW